MERQKRAKTVQRERMAKAEKILATLRPNTKKIIENQDIIRKIHAPILDMPQINNLRQTLDQPNTKARLLRKLEERDQSNDFNRVRVADLFRNESKVTKDLRRIKNKYETR